MSVSRDVIADALNVPESEVRCKSCQFAENFINDISQSYDPVKFVEWVKRSPVSGDNAMMNVSNDDAFVDRIHHTDETTANSYGIGYS